MQQPTVRPVLTRQDLYIVTTRDGSDTLFSNSFQTTYHSINGAVSESRHVFIQHGLLTQKHRQQVRILEMGFGTGLNAFLSCLFSKKNNIPVLYTGLESHPIHPDVYRQLDYPGYLAASEHQEVFWKMHANTVFREDEFTFKRMDALNDSIEEEIFDCIYYDAFSPAEQPEMWEQSIFDGLAQRCSQGACLVTYCAQGEARRRMKRAGFSVNRIPGAPGKREMLQAFKI